MDFNGLLKQLGALVQLPGAVLGARNQPNYLPKPGFVFGKDSQGNNNPNYQIDKSLLGTVKSAQASVPETAPIIDPPVASAPPAASFDSVVNTASPGSGSFNRDEIANRIRQGFTGQVGKVPALDYVDNFVNAAQNYPMFRENPYLLPQIAIMETTGGKYISPNHANNILSYGVGNPNIEKIFAGTDIGDVIDRTAREIGQTGSVYAKYRTGKPLTDQELADFITTYAPPHENNTAAYIDGLLKGIKYFSGN